MGTNPYLWSTTAASNATADADINWAEGQLPGTVNGSARGMMAALAAWLKDTNATLSTTGAANAYAVTGNIAYAALATGLVLAVKANHTNTGAATLVLTPAGGGAFSSKAIRVFSTAGDSALSASMMMSSGLYLLVYDSTANGAAGAWILLNPSLQGLGTADAPQFTTIELGHASDTTLSRSSAGVMAVEGVAVPLNSTTSTHTAQQIELGHASDTTLARVAAGRASIESLEVVTAAGAVTDNAALRADGTTGKLQNSAVIIDDSNNVTGVVGLTLSGAVSAATVAGAAVASQANMEANSATDLIVTPGRLKYGPGVLKAACIADSAGAVSLTYGVTSVTDAGTGYADVTFSVTFSAAGQMSPAVTVYNNASTDCACNYGAPATTSVRMHSITASTGALADPTNYSIHVAGDL